VIDLLVATTNRGKLAEVRAHLRNLSLRLVSLQDLTDPPAVVEDGKSFEENALKKARSFAEFSGLVTLADDSGLEVDALSGAPGIHSARYAGEEADDGQNNQKLMRELANVPEGKRTARFVCALALCVPGANAGSDWTAHESCEGEIALAPAGSQGFGYDPLFFFPPLGKTFGELDPYLKATVSHRGKALAKFASYLPQLIDLRAKP
jgi:XTP/dITP diphosphohydrolase